MHHPEMKPRDFWSQYGSTFSGSNGIGIHDNFFDLGGDSILNIQIVSRAVKAGIEITPTQLFQTQTIAALAQEGIKGSQPRPAVSSSPSTRKAYPLTPLQAGMLFHTLKEPNSGIYVEQYRCTLSGQLDQQLFQQAWASLVRQHPALRTSFVWDDPGQPRQVVNDEIDLDWQIKDLDSLSADELSSFENRYLREDRSQRLRPLAASPAALRSFLPGRQQLTGLYGPFITLSATDGPPRS